MFDFEIISQDLSEADTSTSFTYTDVTFSDNSNI